MGADGIKDLNAPVDPSQPNVQLTEMEKRDRERKAREEAEQNKTEGGGAEERTDLAPQDPPEQEEAEEYRDSTDTATRSFRDFQGR